MSDPASETSFCACCCKIWDSRKKRQYPTLTLYIKSLSIEEDLKKHKNLREALINWCVEKGSEDAIINWDAVENNAQLILTLRKEIAIEDPDDLIVELQYYMNDMKKGDPRTNGLGHQVIVDGGNDR